MVRPPQPQGLFYPMADKTHSKKEALMNFHRVEIPVGYTVTIPAEDRTQMLLKGEELRRDLPAFHAAIDAALVYERENMKRAEDYLAGEDTEDASEAVKVVMLTSEFIDLLEEFRRRLDDTEDTNPIPMNEGLASRIFSKLSS